MLLELTITLTKVIFIIAITVGFFAPVLTWVERKQSAIMQDRVGANRADILGFTVLGLFHAIADAIKMFAKVLPKLTNVAVFREGVCGVMGLIILNN